MIGRRAGRSRRQIVIVAARDAAVMPDATGSAADTAALLELARVFEGRPTRKTLVLASVDGSKLGEVGTTELLDELPAPALVDGVLVMSDLGVAARARGPIVQAWSNDTRRAGIGLQRTVGRVDPAGARGRARRVGLRSASSRGCRSRSGSGRRACCSRAGYDAVRHLGQRRAAAGRGRTASSRSTRTQLGALGRATLRTVTALDQGGRPEHGPESYVTAVSQVMAGLGARAAGAARCCCPPWWPRSTPSRGRAGATSTCCRGCAGSAPGWRRSWPASPIAEVLALTGATPTPPPAPVPPDVLPLDGPALGRARRRGGRDGARASGIAASWPRARTARSCGPSGPGRRGGPRARGERRRAGALAREPLRRPARRARGPPLDARRAHGSPAAAPRSACCCSRSARSRR